MATIAHKKRNKSNGKFEEWGSIGYSLLVRIASNALIPAQIRLDREMARPQI